MKSFTVSQIAAACGGKFSGDSSLLDERALSITTDSRRAAAGAVFAAIRGERVDGHSFIPDCMAAGALCSICERTPADGSPHILVPDTQKALIKIAAAYRNEFSIPVIGITGSVGKTSTKELIASVLSQKYNVLKTQGNFNNELGVPLTLFSLDENHEIAVVEMGISDFGEMSVLASMVRPDVCVITNIGSCHLEKLIDRDGVKKAKCEMFNYMNSGGVAVLCGDDDKLSSETTVGGRETVFFGLGNKNNVYADNITTDNIENTAFTVHTPDGDFSASISALGNHMVNNAMAAVAVGRLFSLSNEQISAGLAAYKTVGSRANIIMTEKLRIIDDCYNANPASVKAAIDILAGFEGRRVAILGDMLELGKDAQQLHSDIGAYAADKGIDLVISIGELSLSMYKETRKSVDSEWFLTVEETKLYLHEMLTIGDTVLVKASHGMHFEEIVEYIRAL